MSEWTHAQLGRCVESLDAGVSVNAEDRPHRAGEIGVLKTSALSGYVFHPEQNKAVVQAERLLVAEPVLANSILVSRMNTPALVGESCYVGDAHEELFLPDRIWQLKLRANVPTHVRWLSYVLQSHEYRHFVEVHATGTSGSMKNLPKSALLSLPVSYPDEPEQAKIATVLSTIDSAIEQTKAIVEKLKQVKQGLLHDLLTRGVNANGELRPSFEQAPDHYKESPVGWIPKEWKLGPFGSLCSSSAFGPRFPSDAYDENGPLATLRTTDMNDEGEISLATMPRAAIHPSTFSEHLLQRGDLVISRSGTCGVTGVFSGHELPVVPGAFLIRFRLTDLRTNQFFRRYFNSSLGRPRLEKLSEGGVQKNIKGSDVLGLVVPILPSDEAELIANRVLAVEKNIQFSAIQLHKLRQSKAGLMDDLLTGRVRVTPLLAQ